MLNSKISLTRKDPFPEPRKQKLISKLFFFLSNNLIINNLLVFFRLDAWALSHLGIYNRLRINTNLSPQEMAGFSSRASVQEAIDKAHHDLKTVVDSHLKPGESMLDIGCGAGAYMERFTGRYDVHGIDINEDMVRAGKEKLPQAKFILGDFNTHQFDRKFHLIYSVSVLEFIPPSRLDSFFDKIHSLLHPDGIFFLHYPHALNPRDRFYPDIYYIEYPPVKIEAKTRKKFRILKHEHAFDGRKIGKYDPHPYEPGTRTFKNGYLLIAQAT